MSVEILTKEDLQEFRTLLLIDIKELLQGSSSVEPKKWLKSYQVRNLLKISPGTLQNLRVNGTLPYVKIGGILYYDPEEVSRMMKIPGR